MMPKSGKIKTLDLQSQREVVRRLSEEAQLLIGASDITRVVLDWSARRLMNGCLTSSPYK